jgi:hypothetical protein
MTSDEPYAVLSALIDREAVDPETLARALEDAEGRRTLVDFVRLRRELMDDSENQIDRGDRADERALPRARQWRLAAVILLPLILGAGGGYWLRDRTHTERPPTPTRVITFVPGVDWK